MSRRPIPLAGGTAVLGALVAAILLALLAQPATAAPPVGSGSGGVELTRLGEFDDPVYTAVAPGKANRRLLFVVERGGMVRVIRKDRIQARPFVDVSDRIETGSTEQGLLSIAFDPRYERNRRFYLYYTARDGAITVERFKRRRGARIADPDSGRTVISIPHGSAPNHNGGQVSFGPDGHMWLATGDGGGGCDGPGNAQNTGSLLGKLLRIDPRPGGGYTVPGSNPFVGRTGADEVYAYGLRNPYRFSFDGRRIAIGDVGEDDWEEIDYETLPSAKGANFGWDAYEGFLADPCGTAPIAGTTFPIHAYPHDPESAAYSGCAITGGPVVRDRRLRSLYGRYVYSDFCSGGLQSLIPPAGDGPATGDRPLGPRVTKLSSITTGRAKRVYATSLDGTVFRLDPSQAAANRQPVSTRAGGLRARRVGGFEEPVYVTGPPRSKGLLFVVEKDGRIKSVARHGGTRTFLDIRNRVSSDGERGLLSVAFAPDYRKSRRFYVYYTDRDGDIVVAEFRRSKRNPRKASEKSRRTVIKVPHPGAPNHNGGQVQFGPDGYLYLGTGDGGGGGDPPENAQNLDSLLGKLIRIDPRRRGSRPYTVPASNPFVGVAGRDEIYSYGLRNPYRFSIDRRNGDLAIGDVGQDRWEEIDYLGLGAARGANFGWDAYEGFGRFDSGDASPPPAGGVTGPIAQFSHAAGNCAITGGYVYRGRRAASLRGRYVYADFCRGQIRSLVPDQAGAKNDRPVGLERHGAISSFGEDAKGNLYFTDLRDGVYEIVAKRR